MVKPATKREVVNYLVSEYAINIRQACKCLNLERSSYYYHSQRKEDIEVIVCLNELSEKHPSYGFKKMFHSLRNRGFSWNHKKVYRVYKKLGLNLLRKRKRRLASRERKNLEVPRSYNEVWSIDFMSDALFNSRRFRTLNIIDDYNRESIWIEIKLSIGAMHVNDLLEWIVKELESKRIIASLPFVTKLIRERGSRSIVKKKFKKTSNWLRRTTSLGFIPSIWDAHQNERLRYSDIEELKTGKEALVVWRRNKDNADEVLSIREGKPVRIYQASHSVKALEISPSGKRVIIQEQGEKSGALIVHQVDIAGQNSSETTIEDIGNDFVKLTAVGEENAWGITAIKQSKNKNPGPDIWYGNDHQLESKIDGEISYRHWIWKGNSGSIEKLPAERFSTVVSLNAARYYMVFNENQERDYTRQFPMIKPFLYDREKDHYEPLDKMTPEMVLSRFGKYMVFRNAAGKWYLLEIMSMKKKEIAGQDKSNPLFSSDSRWIYFESKDGLCIYDVEASVMKTAPQTKGFEIKILNAPKKMLYEKTGFDFSSKVMEDKGILLVSATDAQDNRKIFWEMKDGTWRKVTDWAEDNIKMLTKATERDRYVYIRENLNTPPELRVKDRNEKSSLILFKSNGHDISSVGLKKEMLTYTNSERKNLKAILYYPAHFSSEKKYPMIVHVYERQSRGSNQYLSPLQTFPIAFNIRVMLEKGYFVMMPDVVPDASGVGLTALSNVHAALDQVADHPNIDQEKLALIGHSFGGYLTNFIATHSTRFATYISGAGAADITRMYFSYNETSGNPFYWQFENGQYPMWGPFSENKDVYHANNPILFAEKVSAPMLLWVGKEDKRIDAGQVMEFYIGLVRNKKEVVALFYPGQRHVFTRGSAEEKDLSLKIMEWLDYFLQNKKNIPWIDRQMKKNTER